VEREKFGEFGMLVGVLNGRGYVKVSQAREGLNVTPCKIR
jgi:hypothetical protein